MRRSTEGFARGSGKLPLTSQSSRETRLGALARDKGFTLVGSGPLVRSSYRAGEEAVAELLERRRAAER